MVLTFIDRQPSFGERITKSLTGGIKEGIELSMKSNSDHAERVGKLTSRAYKDIPKWYKSRMGFDPSPEEAVALEDEYKNVLQNTPGISEDEARNLALKSIQTREKESRAEEEQTTPEQKRNSFFSREHTPHTPADRLGAGQKLWGQIKDAGKAVKFGATHPIMTAAKFASPIAQIAQPRDQDVTPEGSKHKIRAPSGTPWGQSIESAAGLDELSPEEHKQAEDAALLASFFPVTSALKFGGRTLNNIGRSLGGIGKGERMAQALSGAGKTAEAGAGIGRVAESVAPAERAAIDTAAQEVGLAERITPVPKSGTETRMGKIRPNNPIKQIAETRRTQLKAYPRYASEISEDAAAREARRLKAIPKTEVGEIGLAKRVAQAEQRLPALEQAYTRASARVRAIENSLGKLPKQMQDRYRNLLEVAKDELSAASKDLETGLSNVRSGSTKATVTDSEMAARRKLHEVETAIGEGKEYPLKGYDYSPQMIEKAKGIQKRAKLPRLKPDDFYQQIHERYLGPYRQRLSELNQTIRHPLTPNDSFLKASKERDVVQKLIESAEAEQVIHSHNLGLREISEAKKFSDMTKQLRKVEAKGTKTAAVAEQKMWRNKFTEAKSPAQKAALVDEAAAEAAAKTPNEAAAIRAEGEMLKDDLKVINDEIRSGKEAKTPPWKAEGRKWFDRLGDKIAGITIDYKKLGKDFVVGMAASLIDDFASDTFDSDRRIPLATLFFSSRGRGSRAIGAYFGHFLSGKYKVGRAKRELLSKDVGERRAFEEERGWVKKRAKSEVEEERRSRFASR